MIIFFFGGTSLIINTIGATFVLFSTIWVRSTLPRVRIDALFK
jgi:NADH:ubiquinone oxidoreductase subunit H